MKVKTYLEEEEDDDTDITNNDPQTNARKKRQVEDTGEADATEVIVITTFISYLCFL